MSRGVLLREVMSETGTTQVELSRLSGVRQPRISHYVSGRIEMSDDMLSRLLSCMGFEMEVVHRPVKRRLNRSEERSWRLHRELSRRLDRQMLDEWRPTIVDNLERLRRSTTGQPHERNLDRWQEMVEVSDVLGLHRVLTGLDRNCIEMREVSPLGGLLSDVERSEVLGWAS